MRKRLAFLLAVCLVIVVGCGGKAIANNTMNGQPLMRTVTYEAPLYQVGSVTEREQHTAEDGTPLLSSSYQLLELTAVNLAALSPADQSAARQNVESFNALMRQRMAAAEELNQETVVNAQLAYEQGYMGEEYTDETTASGVILGQIVSVRLDNFNYFGGAHPNRYTLGLTFDLSAGRFIDPAQLADDPEAFRTGVAELLVEKADAMGEEYTSGYWTDYRDIIAHWNEGSVLFDETGMTVIYSPYEIGPYAMGELELTVSYMELEPLMGPSGMEKLGQTAESAE